MKAASKIFRIFVVGMAIMSSLLVSLPRVHAENDNNDYSGLVIISGKIDGFTYDDSLQIPYRYNKSVYADIYTNDDTCHGSVEITWQYSTNVTRTDTFEYSGRHTNILIFSSVSTASRPVDITVPNTQYFSFDPENISATAFVLTEENMYELDNIIDSITWHTSNTAVIKGYSTNLDGPYSFDPISTNQTDIFMKIHLPLYYDNRLWKIKTDITFNGRTSAQIFDTGLISFPHIYYLNNNTGALTERQPRIYPFSNGSYLTLYIDSNMSMNNTNDIIIQVHREFTGLRVLYLDDFPSYIKYIDDNDIEFWQLLDILQNATEYYEKFDNEEQRENLADSVDDYVQTEDNLIDGFDSAITDNSVDPLQLPNSNPGNWGTGFTGSLGLIGHVFNMLTASATGGNAVYLLMNFSLMLGLALLIIGKRG